MTVNLNCILHPTGGMYGLAAREEQDENSERFMNIARGITNTCHESYIRSDTKVG